MKEKGKEIKKTVTTDKKKKVVKEVAKKPVKEKPQIEPYFAEVAVSALELRASPSEKSAKVCDLYQGWSYVIVDEENGWGKLMTGAGWVPLENMKFIKKA